MFSTIKTKNTEELGRCRELNQARLKLDPVDEIENKTMTMTMT